MHEYAVGAALDRRDTERMTTDEHEPTEAEVLALIIETRAQLADVLDVMADAVAELAAAVVANEQ